MIISCLVIHPSQTNIALQFLCVVGSCFGVAIFLRGLRLRLARPQALVSSASVSSRVNVHSLPQHGEKVATKTIQEIIRLSPGPLPMKSADMTQQQRISAALARSGSSTPWVQETTEVAVEAIDPDHSEDRITAINQLDSAPLTPTQKSSNISGALIWSGLALAVLSCYLLVIFH